MEQLASYQKFERAYTVFFGSGTWGRFTFACSVGPIAVAEPGQQDVKWAAHENRPVEPTSGIGCGRVAPLAENGEPSQAPLRATMPRTGAQLYSHVARFYDKLSRLPGEHNYLSQVLALLTPRVRQTENVVPKVRAVLPSVKLPVSRDWMTHTERAGRDGTVTVTVTEMGSSAWIQQDWSGGDYMAGTKFITIVPDQRDWGTLISRPSAWETISDGPFAYSPLGQTQNRFPQAVTSPENQRLPHVLIGRSRLTKTTESALSGVLQPE